MFDNVAFNVVIGLVFIYLLYSLLGTILSEIIATNIGLRARNLKEAVDRMLSDSEKLSFWERLIDSFRLMKNPKNERIDKFYNNPEIKYLGSSGIFSNPSSFKSESFSRTLLYELNGSGPLDKNKIEAELIKFTTLVTQKEVVATPGVSEQYSRTLDLQSAQFVLSLFNYSERDLIKFKLHLEAWFDRTMEQATEWYKRKIQVILLFIGFFMAWFFNADTFNIINKLSIDKDARGKLVSLASAYVQNNEAPKTDTATINLLKINQAKLNEILLIKKKLDVDIDKANSVLGAGSWLPDNLTVSYDSVEKKFVAVPAVDEALLKHRLPIRKVHGVSFYEFGFRQKLDSFFSLFFPHFGGFLITALAISLGAPFWFDLLNKLMQLRTSIKQPTDAKEPVSDNTIRR